MSLYGPRPGERVCKVNFSKLSDAEKRNTNLLLAKQDHEIVFDQEEDGYIANIKFVKSPNKDYRENTSSAEKSKSRSPNRNHISVSGYPFNPPNLLTDQRSLDRIHYDPRTPEKKKVYHARPLLKPAPNNGGGRLDSRSRDKRGRFLSFRTVEREIESQKDWRWPRRERACWVSW